MNYNNNWHVLTVTHGGQVSLLKNLSKDAAIHIARRLTPSYNRPNNIKWHAVRIDDQDMTTIEVFGPEGETVEIFTSQEWRDAQRPTTASADSPPSTQSHE